MPQPAADRSPIKTAESYKVTVYLTEDQLKAFRRLKADAGESTNTLFVVRALGLDSTPPNK